MGCGGSASVKAENPIQSNKNTPGSATKGHNQSYFIRENEKEVKDNYIIKNKLGEGSFGVVRKIVDRSTGEEKALKIISKSNSLKDQEQTLLSEINIMKTLDHPSIAKMYEYYQDKNNFYIVTEIVKGGELFDKIVDLSQFSERDAAHIFKQLISVIQYAHENKIMHRDIQPSNILLEHNPSSKDTKFSIKIVDWGSAVIFSETREKKLAGSQFYMAPEVIKKNYSQKCDIWSCGVILYIMLTGEPPFYGTDNEIMQSILDLKYEMNQPVWSTISEDCKSLIKQMLCPEEQRLTSKQVQEHPWIVKNLSSQKQSSFEQQQSINSLTTLKKFTTKNQFHVAVLTFISSQLTLKEDQAKFKTLFEQLDKNNDGYLTKDEIEFGFGQYNSQFNGDYNVEIIFANIDTDGNGKINYSEFITASLQAEALLIDGNLKKTFQAFDTDGNNYLTIDELKEIFGGNSSKNDKEVLQVISTIDLNGDGKISFDEFKAMMKNYSERK